jgi:hypothetical protein
MADTDPLYDNNRSPRPSGDGAATRKKQEADQTKELIDMAKRHLKERRGAKPEDLDALSDKHSAEYDSIMRRQLDEEQGATADQETK